MATTTKAEAAPPVAAPTEPEPERKPEPEQLPACGQSSKLGLEGLTEEQVQRRFGPPSERETFRVEERGGEFHATVQNAYPTTNRKNWGVPIRQFALVGVLSLSG